MVYVMNKKNNTMVLNYSDIVNFNKMLDSEEDDAYENLDLEAGSPGLLHNQQSTLDDEKFIAPLNSPSHSRRPSLTTSGRHSFHEESKEPY